MQVPSVKSHGGHIHQNRGARILISEGIENYVTLRGTTPQFCISNWRYFVAIQESEINLALSHPPTNY